MIKFEYDDLGILHVYRDGKDDGIIVTMGDSITSKPKKEEDEDGRRGNKD